jgi:hypothetical protein
MNSVIYGRIRGFLPLRLKEKGFCIFSIYSFLVVLFIYLFLLSFFPLSSSVVGQNVTVTTTLEVGAVYPEILNISIDDGVNVTLVPNSTQNVMCHALIQDWNNITDVYLVNATLFHSTSSAGAADNNNTHYTNSSCAIDTNTHDKFGVSDDIWHGLANCSFDVLYHAESGVWNCTVYVEDVTNRSNVETDEGAIDELLAIGMQNTIDYGVVNSTDVSGEQQVDVENVGNVELNLTLDGYAQSIADGYAMNCSKGVVGNQFIPIMYEKYNLTNTTSDGLINSLSDFENYYENMTSTGAPSVRQFNLFKRNTTRALATEPVYFRIYVPKGIAGTCEGNIEFGGTVAPGS